MEEVVLVASAAFFAAMGLFALAAPAALVHPFGLVATSAVSRSEVRAVYGGFGVAMAGVLTWCATDDDAMRDGAASAVGISLAGMAVGRAISRLLDAPTSFYPNWFYCLVEITVGGLVMVVLRT
ncbi:DUF4345 domain-containing protein [Saccharopolyspora karakumensis]|uniref:DUF4345 domain-containing protein n=1 Tax=Saccharopolyspora karakumensis TaxID=2530386 RepID=A0A4R5BKA7_9PSEU|nr:DUF4345 domain-containing protein [Saccharopolyspora karakumensis]TDD84232.1 DUF4345 domain-containing protein [Saccharopolyspora karakumensis]